MPYIQCCIIQTHFKLPLAKNLPQKYENRFHNVHVHNVASPESPNRYACIEANLSLLTHLLYNYGDKTCRHYFREKWLYKIA